MPDSGCPFEKLLPLAAGERVTVRTIKNRNRQNPPLHRRQSVRTASQTPRTSGRARPRSQTRTTSAEACSPLTLGREGAHTLIHLQIATTLLPFLNVLAGSRASSPRCCACRQKDLSPLGPPG